MAEEGLSSHPNQGFPVAVLRTAERWGAERERTAAGSLPSACQDHLHQKFWGWHLGMSSLKRSTQVPGMCSQGGMRPLWSLSVVALNLLPRGPLRHCGTAGPSWSCRKLQRKPGRRRFRSRRLFSAVSNKSCLPKSLPACVCWG